MAAVPRSSVNLSGVAEAGMGVRLPVNAVRTRAALVRRGAVLLLVAPPLPLPGWSRLQLRLRRRR